jgi:hypothetical protein
MKVHNLTTAQLQKLTDAISDGKDWPKFTDDPKVNYAIDCMTCLMVNDLEPDYHELIYAREIAAAKEQGL